MRLMGCMFHVCFWRDDLYQCIFPLKYFSPCHNGSFIWLRMSLWTVSQQPYFCVSHKQIYCPLLIPSRLLRSVFHDDLAVRCEVFFHMQLVLTSEVYATDTLITLGLSPSLWLYVSVNSPPRWCASFWECLVFLLKMASLNLIWRRRCAARH